MNINQKNFLVELETLLRKYNIDKIMAEKINPKDNMDSISLISNSERLSFAIYKEGVFYGVENSEYIAEFEVGSHQSYDEF